VPRSLQFLFSRNRLNVAVVARDVPGDRRGSPLLLESRARTIEQMRLDQQRSAASWIWSAPAV